MRLWDMATRQPAGNPLTGHTGPVRALAFHPDGHLLATASVDVFRDGPGRTWSPSSAAATSA
ncbi:hypothetical protein [Microbispora triticiradicis]|uniref:hypothetical protein n=1 Tax=Microbispora triticiradicis TaxID=2200763 RepID=UPI0031343628